MLQDFYYDVGVRLVRCFASDNSMSADVSLIIRIGLLALSPDLLVGTVSTYLDLSFLNQYSYKLFLYLDDFAPHLN